MDPGIAVALGGGLIILGMVGMAAAAFAGWRAHRPAVRLAEHKRDIALARAEVAEARVKAIRARAKRSALEDGADLAWAVDLERAAASGDDALWDRVLLDAPTEDEPTSDRSAASNTG